MRGEWGSVENIVENNIVEVVGTVNSALNYSHEVYGEGFYEFTLKVPRLSEINDYIPVTVSERLIKDMNLKVGERVEISGQFRSYNNYSNASGNRLILTVFAKDIKILEPDKKVKNPNYIYLNGYICKVPVYRTTPFGREISDILLAVNRSYNKSDYIPCIAWGRNARYSATLKVGENIKIWGRIQSREYQKKISNTETITRTAYEVSISKMEVVNKEVIDTQGDNQSDAEDNEDE
ncbi:MAG: single-stranded DNA-binding protein [Clostridiaceae bacterium]|nr:single-stranded DNA-binding protein [Clostridiaceae bacterium]